MDEIVTEPDGHMWHGYNIGSAVARQVALGKMIRDHRAVCDSCENPVATIATVVLTAIVSELLAQTVFANRPGGEDMAHEGAVMMVSTSKLSLHAAQLLGDAATGALAVLHGTYPGEEIAVALGRRHP